MLSMKAQLYKEAHIGTYTMIKLNGDQLVNHGLDSRLVRESLWLRKSSTIFEADTTVQSSIEKVNIIILLNEGNKNNTIQKA